MDPAVASIAAALISAAASVIVALIGNSSSARTLRRAQALRVYESPTRNRPAWNFVISILSLWLLLSPVLIHWDWGGINFFLLPIVTLLLSAVWPITPSRAAAVVLILYPINFLMEPLGWWVAGISGGYEISSIAFLLGLAFVNAAGSWALARWRGRGFVEITESTKHPEGVATKSRSATPLVADELAKLNKLHESGALSDEEFRRAKDRLLDT